MKASTHFFLAIPVWGEKFIDHFLHLVLPNWLSRNNLTKASSLFSFEFALYTRPQDVSIFHSASSFRKLQTLMPGKIYPILNGTILESEKHKALGICHAKAWKEASQKGCVLLYPSPDCLLADGGYVTCCTLIEKGYKVVNIAAINRGCLEEIAEIVTEKFYDSATQTITIGNRDLMEIAISHLHPSFRFAFYNSKNALVYPTLVHFGVGKKSLMSKFFHLHPLAIDLRFLSSSIAIDELLLQDTIDGLLVSLLKLRKKDIYVVQMSDEIAAVELTSKDHLVMEARISRYKPYLLSRVCHSFSPAYKKNFLSYSFCYQTHENIDWKREEKKILRKLYSYRLLVRLFTFVRPLVLWLKGKT